MYSTVESVRKEQNLQLEEILAIKLQISAFSDKLGFFEDRISKIESSISSINQDNLENSKINIKQSNDLSSIKKTLGTGFVLKTMRDQEALKSELRSLRSAIEEMELKQTQFNSRLRNFYTDIDYRLKNININQVDINNEDSLSENIENNSETIENSAETSSLKEETTSLDNEQINEIDEEEINYIEENDTDNNSDEFEKKYDRSY